MPAALHYALQLRAPANVERTHAFGPVELVGGKGEQIDTQGIYVRGNLAHALHGIGMQVDVLLRSQPADLLQRLDGSDLVVGMHDGDENGVGANGRLQGGEIDQALAGHGQIGDLKALLLQFAAGLQDGRMLDAGGDDMFARCPYCAAMPFRARLSDSVPPEVKMISSGFAAQELCHLLPGLFQSLFCLQAKAVQAGGIAELLGKVGQHGLQDLGRHGSGGGVVHVNPLHRETLVRC